MPEAPAQYNAKIIAEFRANQGRVGGIWVETPLLLLHHTGAKSGVSRVNPVAYLSDDERYLIWAANGGAPNNPAWYHNLMAHPTTRIEVGSETIEVVAEEATGVERERPWAKATGRYPQLIEAAGKTSRAIPMVVLTPRGTAQRHPTAERTRREQCSGDAMTPWTTSELERIGRARELELACLGSDGALRKPVTIWVVRQGDDLYVRSWRGPGSAWFRGAHLRREGHIRAGGVEKDVTLIDTDDPGVNAAIDVRYRAKYGDSRYVTPMITEPARATTIKLIPR